MAVCVCVGGAGRECTIDGNNEGGGGGHHEQIHSFKILDEVK